MRAKGADYVAYVNFDEYNRSQSAWKTHPAAMIVKVAEQVALKATFGFASLQIQEEFIKDDSDRVIPIDHEQADTYMNDLNREILERLDEIDGEQANKFREKIQERKDAGEWTEDRAKQMLKDLKAL